MKYKTMRSFTDENALRDYVAECDRRLDTEIEAALRCIEEAQDLRLFGLTGPTCSGKTTAAKKITSYLEEKGLRVHVVSVDDFYFDKEYLQKRADADPEIEIDYDSEDTIDIDLLAEQTKNLLACKETFLPRFDFRSGKRIGGETLIPRAKDVFLFEGIQILYPRVNHILSQSGNYQSIYICPLSTLQVGALDFEPNEIRLMRRLVRDYLHRATAPSFTFYLWKSVRENEDKNIFPYAHNCNAQIDSTMPYEIGMLKPYLMPLLEEITTEDPSYEEASRILEKLRGVSSVSHRYMTENSLYKEFI
ncbi:MAG: hypothetical protein E7643_00675 [Ruminococcaceae bacterium]|nr:hypothetical protein [Oscillospiraceae bacterium]